MPLPTLRHPAFVPVLSLPGHPRVRQAATIPEVFGMNMITLKIFGKRTRIGMRMKHGMSGMKIKFYF